MRRLDVKRVFNKIRHPELLDELKKKSIPYPLLPAFKIIYFHLQGKVY